MPNYVPPQTPQVNVPANVQQDQNQNQNQQSDIFVEDRSQNSSESESQSRSEVIQAPINSQTNITNSNSDYFGFGIGKTRPVPTFFGTVVIDDYSEQIQLGFKIPIGGRTSKLSTAMIENEIKAQTIANATSEFSFCNSLDKQNILINYSMLPEDHPAHFCDGLIISKVVEVPAPPKSVELNSIKQELKSILEMNRKLQIQNQKLQNQLQLKYQANPFSPVDDGG